MGLPSHCLEQFPCMMSRNRNQARQGKKRRQGAPFKLGRLFPGLCLLGRQPHKALELRNALQAKLLRPDMAMFVREQSRCCQHILASEKEKPGMLLRAGNDSCDHRA